jgi:hypothetical protein
LIVLYMVLIHRYKSYLVSSTNSFYQWAVCKNQNYDAGTY